MNKLEREGSSVEAVIAAFRREYKIKDWELKYEIIKKPSAGFFGLFARKTAVLSFELPAVQDRVRLFLGQLLDKMGISYAQIRSKREGKNVHLDVIDCKDPGFLIGKNGYMLENIQFLLNRIFENDRRLDGIYLDTDGYREKQDAQFLRSYKPQIGNVVSSGKALTLNPMPASERRVIHRYVASQKDLRTLTIGDGDKKRIVIFHAKQSEKEVLSQTGGRPARKPRPSGRPTEQRGKPTEQREQREPREQRGRPRGGKPQAAPASKPSAPVRKTPPKQQTQRPRPRRPKKEQ